ncbi:MAG: hypothetical protein IJ736_13295 [Firmicutes bacterium]|nr:hypothetical protein [Bacillota bacterium]
MEKVTLSIYNESFTAIERQAEAKLAIVPFGTVRKLMAIFGDSDISDSKKIANAILSSWDSLIGILDRVFPDVSEEEWERVNTAELIRCVVALIQYATSQILTIPTEKN